MFLSKLPANSCTVPSSAIILAAGRGKRMLPLTDRIPKPMLVVMGKTIIDRTIDHLLGAGVKKIVINVSHLAPIIVEYVRDRADDRIVVSEEDTPLETGGGVVKAVPELGDQPFFVVNGDSLWVDGMKSPLLRLAENWNKDKMDALLMLAPIARAANFDGLGDFIMNQNGNLERRLEKTVSPFAYMGLSIVNPKVLSGAPKGAFSLNWLYDRAIDRGRLSGLVHDGLWYHISTPSDLEIARRRFSDGHASAVAAFF